MIQTLCKWRKFPSFYLLCVYFSKFSFSSMDEWITKENLYNIINTMFEEFPPSFIQNGNRIRSLVFSRILIERISHLKSKDSFENNCPSVDQKLWISLAFLKNLNYMQVTFWYFGKLEPFVPIYLFLINY